MELQIFLLEKPSLFAIHRRLNAIGKAHLLLTFVVLIREAHRARHGDIIHRRLLKIALVVGSVPFLAHDLRLAQVAAYSAWILIVIRRT